MATDQKTRLKRKLAHYRFLRCDLHSITTNREAMGDDVMVLTLTRETRAGSERVASRCRWSRSCFATVRTSMRCSGRLRRNRSRRSRRGPRRPEDRQTAREPGPGLTRKEIYERLHPETKKGGDRKSEAQKSKAQHEPLRDWATNAARSRRVRVPSVVLRP
jgi:hypothetical protein